MAITGHGAPFLFGSVFLIGMLPAVIGEIHSLGIRMVMPFSELFFGIGGKV